MGACRKVQLPWPLSPHTKEVKQTEVNEGTKDKPDKKTRYCGSQRSVTGLNSADCSACHVQLHIAKLKMYAG